MIKKEWDLSLLLSSEDPKFIDAKKKAVESAWLKFIKKWQDNSDYLTNSKVLKTAIDEYKELSEKYGLDGGIGYYFELKDALNQGDTTIKAQINKITEFRSSLANKLNFFTHRLSLIDQARQIEFLNAPDLFEYKHFLERLFAESKYLLSEKEEQLLNLVYKPAKYNWNQMVESSVSNDQENVLTEEGEVKKLPMSLIAPLLETRKKEVRDRAAKALFKIRKRWATLAENELNSVLEFKRNLDALRGFKRPDESRHLSDDIETEVVDSMVESVTNNFDLVADYFEFKAKLVKKEQLEIYESLIGIEYLDESIDTKHIKKFKFEEAYELVASVLGDLDPEFKIIFEDFFKEGRVDVEPKKGKTNGAFCAAEGKTSPIYIMLNFTGKLQDCFTMAHEMGHGINDVLMRKQNEINYGTVLSTAEVASTFMEDFVWQKVASSVDDEQRLILTMQKIEDDINTIFMQVACYNFEKSLHKNFAKKGYLSKEEISKIFLKEFKNLYGKSVKYKKSKFKWVVWSHIRSYFYVYSYASGLLISKSLQASVKKDPKYISKVKEFLSAGLSESPKDIFANLNINITDKSFWNNGIVEIKELIESAKVLAKKLGKI